MLVPASWPALFTGPHELPHGEAGGSGPAIDSHLGPGGHGHGAHAASLPDQVDDHPAAVARLDVFDRQGGEFASAEPTTDQ